MTKPLVYIAGPYSKPDPCWNTHDAVQQAEALMVMAPNAIPVIPHLSHFWHTMVPHPYEFWLDLDLEIMRRCDAVYRFPGESSGADAEVVKANEWGIPVFTDVVELVDWLLDWIYS